MMVLRFVLTVEADWRAPVNTLGATDEFELS